MHNLWGAAASRLGRFVDEICWGKWEYDVEDLEAYEAEVWFWRRLAGKTLSGTAYCPNCDYEVEVDPKNLFALTASPDGACGTCFGRLAIRLGIKGIATCTIELLPEPAETNLYTGDIEVLSE